MTSTDLLSSKQSSNGELYYPMTHEEWCSIAKRLKPAEIKVLYYIRTLDPFGDSWIDIQVTTIAEQLGMDKSTVSRALKTLACSGDIDLEIQLCRVRLASRTQELSTRNSLRSDRACCPQETPTIATQHLNECSDLKPLQEASSENEDVPIVLNTLLNKTNGSPTTHPVQEGQEEIGTNAQLWERLAAADIAPNKTIQRVLGNLENQQGAVAAAKAVENAISALKEQQSKGTVRNPGGFITAALRRGFTANQAKKEHRERSRGGPAQPASSSTTQATMTRQKPPTRSPLDVRSLSMSVFMALHQGDRQFALAKLQHCWAEGWQQEVEELCILMKRDWKFKITAEGVVDGER